MPLNTKTFDQIVNEIFARLTAAGITDFNPGSVARTLVEAFAYGLDEVWYAISQVPDKFFIDKATGEWLDRRAWEWGLTRNPGTKAKGNVIVSRSTPAPFGQLIPKGTQFAYGDLVYQSTQDAELPQGATEAAVPVEAVAVGKAYNLPAGVELKQVGIAISLIETVRVAPEGITGGVDPESDEELRQRIMATIKNPIRGGTKRDYETWAQAAGAKVAKCIPAARGPGTVDVLVITQSGLPDEQFLQQVQAYIEERRPLGADVRVIAPQVLQVNITATVMIASGYSQYEVINNINSALAAYIASIPIGGIIRPTAIGSTILGVQGVEDYTLAAPTSNITLAPDQIAQLGQVQITVA